MEIKKDFMSSMSECFWPKGMSHTTTSTEDDLRGTAA